jgi:hypothetical protein
LLKKSGIRTLLIKKSSGKLSAQMRMALDYSLKQGYEGVVFMDGNNKDDPSDLPRFEEMLSAGYDHIQGSRILQGAKAINNPALRIIGIKSIHAPLISLAAGFRYTDTTNGFRAYSRRFLLDARVQPFREVFSEYELHYYLAIRAARLGFKTIEIPVSRIYPPGPIPTHISRFRGNWIVMRTLFMACLGFYNPHSDSLKTA